MAKADRAPKKIAGLKLPKSIRQAPAIRSLLATPAGRRILSEALIEGAATAAQRVIEAHKAAKATGAVVELPKAKAAVKRAKNGKPAPGAAPANDVAAPKPLAPLASKPAPVADKPKPAPAALDDDDDFDKPGAAD
ncbi:hypothetical protein IZ6_14340 [Terrihabitans soli]|uniref:Uncharacterized protein n=1 Tax=Terrihabitans soli TaxID=708113 RepID=A0A6S6QP14_9HYPH|nr:hypothetical protein [Terrihabitans soli]BCJ90699.1 hypothetical protein IZ6_14340 [Terrihabitans soli]